MGCVASKERRASDADRAHRFIVPWSYQRSFSTIHFFTDKSKLRPEDFQFCGRRDVAVVKEPGSIGGQQFVIEDCENCDIFLCDVCDSVQVNSCKNCRIFAAPISGSIYFRDCSSLKCVVACGQFRTFNFNDSDISLYCSSQPTIEESKNLRFGCFQYFYFQLREQFDAAQISVFTNKWWDVYDFSHNNKWSLLPPDVTSSSLLRNLEDLTDFVAEGETRSARSVVPLTLGSRPKASDESVFVLFFAGQAEVAEEFLDMLSKAENLSIVRMKETTILPSQSEKLLEVSSFVKKRKALENCSHGPVIGMELNGVNCQSEVAAKIASFLKRVKDISKVPSAAEEMDASVMHYSKSREEANHMIEYFFTQLERQERKHI